MTALLRLNDFMLIANQSKKLAHDMLWAIVQELDAKDCPKMTLKILGDIEFYAEHMGVRISNSLREIMEEMEDEAKENISGKTY